MAIDYKLIKAQLDELKSHFEKLGSTVAPVEQIVTKGPEDQGTPEPSGRRILTPLERFELRDQLKKKSTPELLALFDMQLVDGERKGLGIPYGVWAATGGGNVNQVMAANPEIRKALDSTGGAALIRQDLEPVLYELFVRDFPAFDRFAKEPANGLVHAFDQITDYGDAKFLSELGTVTDDNSTYTRKTTNVAILATRRGVSLKNQFATLQSGSGFNPENLELQSGMRAMAHRMQVTIFQGNATVSSGTASDEDGEFDANAFTGLRQILNGSDAVNADNATPSGDLLRDSIDEAILPIINKGGSANVIYMRAKEKQTWDEQQDQNVRYIGDLANLATGTRVSTVNTSLGPLPLFPVPGDSIGTYTDGGGDLRADMYILDERTISLPFLGTAGPTVLDIPIGISGQLTHLYIIFGMWGLAVKALPFSNKVRVKVTA